MTMGIAGWACDASTPCGPEFPCTNGICTQIAQAGEACSSSAVGPQGGAVGCADAFECTNGMCQPQGDQAGSLQARGDSCANSSRCMETLSCVSGICQGPPGSIGSACSQQQPCVSVMECKAAVCSVPDARLLGEACSQDRPCLGAYDCTASVCTLPAPRLQDELCREDRPCDTDLDLVCIHGEMWDDNGRLTKVDLCSPPAHVVGGPCLVDDPRCTEGHFCWMRGNCDPGALPAPAYNMSTLGCERKACTCSNKPRTHMHEVRAHLTFS